MARAVLAHGSGAANVACRVSHVPAMDPSALTGPISVARYAVRIHMFGAVAKMTQVCHGDLANAFRLVVFSCSCQSAAEARYWALAGEKGMAKCQSRGYQRVKGRSHTSTVEKRKSVHPHKPHATSQPSRFSHTPRLSTDSAHNQHSH